jgi:hypothetical protein
VRSFIFHRVQGDVFCSLADADDQGGALLREKSFEFRQWVENRSILHVPFGEPFILLSQP